MKTYYTEHEFAEHQTVKIMEDTHAVEPEHTHDFVELVYIQEGDVIHGVGERYTQVHSGGVVYVDVGQKHFYCSTGKVKFINIAVRKDFFDNVVLRFAEKMNLSFGVDNIHCCAQFEGEEKAYIERLLTLILWEYKEQQTGGDEIVREYFKILFAIVARRLSEQHLAPMAMDLKSYIEMRCFDHIGIEEIAQVFGYNPKYLSKKFKKEYGVSIKSYVNTLRVKAAVQMLENTDFSIERIATCVGYADAKQIYQVFKKYFGMTPKTLRERTQTNDNSK